MHLNLIEKYSVVFSMLISNDVIQHPKDPEETKVRRNAFLYYMS